MREFLDIFASPRGNPPPPLPRPSLELLAKLRKINRFNGPRYTSADLFDATQLSAARSCVGCKLINAPPCILRTYRGVLILIRPRRPRFNRARTIP